MKGKRRKVDWTSYTPSNRQLSQITRGYTFREQLDPVGLVHMNDRVYDADIGRYPLSYTDPKSFLIFDR